MGVQPTGIEASGRAERRTPGRRFLWAAAALMPAAALLVYASAFSHPPPPAGSLTGDGDRMDTAVRQTEPDQATLEAAIRRRPADLDARRQLARLAMKRGDWETVGEQAQFVLAHSPNDPEALGEQGLVRFAHGEPEVAISLLQRALTADPARLEAYAILSLIYAKTGRMEIAEHTMQTAEQLFPDRRAVLEEMLAQLREQARREASTAPGAAQGQPASGRAAGTLLGPLRAAGTVELATAVTQTGPPTGVLFVIVRTAHTTSGPPTAVRRLDPGPFPVRFAIDDTDTMLGQPFAPRLRVEARLDRDGDPLTQQPGDLHAELDDIPAGAQGLVLILHP